MRKREPVVHRATKPKYTESAVPEFQYRGPSHLGAETGWSHIPSFGAIVLLGIAAVAGIVALALGMDAVHSDPAVAAMGGGAVALFGAIAMVVALKIRS